MIKETTVAQMLVLLLVRAYPGMSIAETARRYSLIVGRRQGTTRVLRIVRRLEHAGYVRRSIVKARRYERGAPRHLLYITRTGFEYLNRQMAIFSTLKEIGDSNVAERKITIRGRTVGSRGNAPMATRILQGGGGLRGPARSAVKVEGSGSEGRPAA